MLSIDYGFAGSGLSAFKRRFPVCRQSILHTIFNNAVNVAHVKLGQSGMISGSAKMEASTSCRERGRAYQLQLDRGGYSAIHYNRISGFSLINGEVLDEA